MKREIEEKLPESLLEVIGFEYDEENDQWQWLSNDGEYKAVVHVNDIKYVSVFTTGRDDEGEIECLYYLDDFSIGEFIDRYIFRSIE